MSRAQDREAMAKRLRAFAMECSKWDRSDVLDISADVGHGRMGRARRKMERLDTVVREGIPEEVWRYVLLNGPAGSRQVKVVAKEKAGGRVIGEAVMKFPGDMSDDALATVIARDSADILGRFAELSFELVPNGSKRKRRKKA